MPSLRTGERLRAEQSRASCEVGRYIGGGGQGEVYEVRLGSDLFALKWYLPASATPQQRTALVKIIESGPPTDRFLWPFDLVSGDGRGGFGYLMPLRPRGYHGLIEIMHERKARCTYRALTTAAFQLADSFSQLHLKGLCYCDISFGNVFLQPATGDILVCDNDNVAVNRSGAGGVLGTLPFMAPEIVRSEALPSTQTDLHSLAVLLFYMLMRHHPLHGKKEAAIHALNYPAMLMLYGREPVFVFDPHDESNRPDPEYHATVLDFWPRYPQFLRDLFTTAFTDGVRHADHGRVREPQWKKALVRLRDAIVYGATGAENFYCDEYRRQHGGALRPCWRTGQEVPIPFRIELGRQTMVVLNHDTQLFPHHLDGDKLWDFSTPSAAVSQHPQNPAIWGLKNLTARRWVFRHANGQSMEVETGRSVTLSDGTEIDFGTAKGTLRR